MAAVEETLKYIRERQRVKIRNKEIKGNIKRAQTLDRGREGKKCYTQKSKFEVFG